MKLLCNFKALFKCKLINVYLQIKTERVKELIKSIIISTSIFSFIFLIEIKFIFIRHTEYFFIFVQLQSWPTFPHYTPLPYLPPHFPHSILLPCCLCPWVLIHVPRLDPHPYIFIYIVVLKR